MAVDKVQLRFYFDKKKDSWASYIQSFGFPAKIREILNFADDSVRL